ncbi:uncharacterized protein EI97DRAFT_45198 [Westerdykella ornata]|uniref:Uncharacterized protein n=1 Tax=Westerdykella ornata TaxID=318751 RepID=A0A6A6JIW6_WESOR|nr:uncharacterized protein EI97DRAFT_45198 [Westerdykella ornata]KAF2276600.1 hypothetical protein EI97DRAFT_45198 [Westerdykella ornata]
MRIWPASPASRLPRLPFPAKKKEKMMMKKKRIPVLLGCSVAHSQRRLRHPLIWPPGLVAVALLMSSSTLI